MYVFGCQRTGGALKKQTFACLMDLDWHIYIFTYIHIYMFTYLHFYIYTYIYIHIYLYAYLHIHIFTYIHIRIHIYIYIYWIAKKPSPFNRVFAADRILTT